jgi:hypothetical protein
MDERLEHLTQLLQQLSLQLEQVKLGLQQLVRVNDDHEERMRVLERWRNNLTPILAVGTFVMGCIFAAALDHLPWK